MVAVGGDRSSSLCGPGPLVGGSERYPCCCLAVVVQFAAEEGASWTRSAGDADDPITTRVTDPYASLRLPDE